MGECDGEAGDLGTRPARGILVSEPDPAMDVFARPQQLVKINSRRRMAEQLLEVTPSDQLWIESPLLHLKRCEAAARAGDLRPGTEAYAACAFHPQPDLTEALNKAYHDLSLRASYWRALASEYATSLRDRADGPLGDMPLIVLSAGARERSSHPPEESVAVENVWARGHERLAALPSRGVRRIVPDSKHAIHWDRPQAVIDAVLEVVAEVRGGSAS